MQGLFFLIKEKNTLRKMRIKENVKNRRTKKAKSVKKMSVLLFLFVA